LSTEPSASIVLKEIWYRTEQWQPTVAALFVIGFGSVIAAEKGHSVEGISIFLLAMICLIWLKHLWEIRKGTLRLSNNEIQLLVRRGKSISFISTVARENVLTVEELPNALRLFCKNNAVCDLPLWRYSREDQSVIRQHITNWDIPKIDPFKTLRRAS
jgi:hypothetical protein